MFLIFSCPNRNKDGNRALEPLDVPLGRMCWTTIRWVFFHVLSHKRSARAAPWERQKKKFFLDVSQTMVCLSAWRHARKFYRHLPADTKASEATEEFTYKQQEEN